MSRVPNVTRKQGIYYYRRLIRLGVQKPFRIRISLRTRCHKRASLLSAALTLFCEQAAMTITSNSETQILTAEQRAAIFREQLLIERDRLEVLHARLQIAPQDFRADGTPSLADFRHALRDVARSCLYGVDRNPMAVELAKVALWIETVDPGLPLGFFDAQIRCGDALLGVFDLKALEDGIPDAAYKALGSDDKDVARYYVGKNRREQAEKERVAKGFGFHRAQDLIQAFEALRSMPEDTVKQIEAKAARLEELTAHGAAAWQLETACDLYISAFFMPKVKGGDHSGPDGMPRRGAETIPTSGTLWEWLRGVQPFGPLFGQAIDVARRAKAFHWPLQFPDVMQRGGFDVVLGNPPWERIKLQEQEFFALKDAEIATAKNAAARKKLIERLDQTNPRLAQEWRDALRTAAAESQFMRESGRFPRGGVGDVNTYAVFTDLCWQALQPSGRAGLIIPNGLVVGFTYREFLRQLLSNKSLVSFYGFENEDKIFKDVHNETKFGLLTIGGKDVQIEQPWFTAHIRQPAEIADPAKRYALTVDEIRAINPNTLNLTLSTRARCSGISIIDTGPTKIRLRSRRIRASSRGSLLFNTRIQTIEYSPDIG